MRERKIAVPTKVVPSRPGAARGPVLFIGRFRSAADLRRGPRNAARAPARVAVRYRSLLSYKTVIIQRSRNGRWRSSSLHAHFGIYMRYGCFIGAVSAER
ncbi:hypothetical protein EVAR_148_1 [Eumeta japonica]|uniref:Uncharacterized protein n=1 Tax=Eumeta variegata TaxID=151549 RepID=A0A4C1S8R9_EUMVA|nr:hypothetical protein EVAR_148_1 [Eumeta japonica]